MSNEENELLKLYESQYTGRLFEKANSYLLERNSLFDEREKLYNLLDKIKKYIEQEPLFEDPFGEGEHTFLGDVNTKYYKNLIELLEEIE